MMRALLLWAVPCFVGTSLVLAELLPRVRWLGRPNLVSRLAPYAPGHPTGLESRRGSPDSLDEVLTSFASSLSTRVATALGVTEPLDRRLRRVHASEDAVDVRRRQGRWMAAALVAGVGLASATPTPPVLSIVAVFGSPLLALLLIEQRVSAASTRWQQQLTLELPTIAEQLGMLLSAGRSLGGALTAVAERGAGAAAQDLRRVMRRIDQGLSEAAALAEWAELADVGAVQRLVSIFALNQETADLGALVTEEARSLRRDAHRQLVEDIERRTEQVWIPVTVAALVPGTLLIGVPFVDALQLFSTG